MMSKSFSTREKVLLMILIVLLLAAFYYLAVFKPTSDAMSDAKTSIAETADLMVIEQAKAEQIIKMQEALEQVYNSSETYAVTPLFDNFQNLLDELNVALDSAIAYKLNFLEPVISDGIAKRELQLVFHANNYNHTKNIINQIYSGPYRCEINSFKLEPTEEGANDLTVAPVTATLNITYYEIYKETAQEAVAAQ